MMRGWKLVNRIAALCMMLFFGVLGATVASAEDGYQLWLRYSCHGSAPSNGASKQDWSGIQVLADMSPTIEIALEELDRARNCTISGDAVNGLRLVLVRGDYSRQKGVPSDGRLADAAPGAYTIRETATDGIIIAANDDIGLLYGTFALLRQLQVAGELSGIDRYSAPTMPLRMLNHWDNPDGHVERGYAGRSIFDWWHLPEQLDPRMLDYARANSSIGINGVVVNNVNASAYMLSSRYITKLQRLADAWRPYGIRVFLSARFSAPRDIGGLNTADPLDPAVRAWWQAKAEEIYRAIPDFGGFLVKANSEGQPGPQDYGRTHADGANMLAEALGKRGTVIWRAFVYSAEDETDRAKQAYAEFVPLDGQFAGNVIIQVKNGPIDFQPREPFHPMFGAMPNTKVMFEAQVTREYLGQATGIVYLAPMWTEILDAQTGRGGTVADIIEPVGMAGVANTGSARNWTGNHFDQANWYAFGRLAWDPELTAETIALEWAAQTFSHEPATTQKIAKMMLGSREAVVKYMTPLGLAHLMATGHHYGPAPWVCDLARPEWNPCYYHRASKVSVGFDRTESGSDTLSQYDPAIAATWSDPNTIDPKYLLWFHRLRWDTRLSTGQTLWEALVGEYDKGVASVDQLAKSWAGLEGQIDPERFRAVTETLAIQRREARWWRDASIAYWQSVNGLALPHGAAAVEESLEAYQARRFPEAPGQ